MSIITQDSQKRLNQAVYNYITAKNWYVIPATLSIDSHGKKEANLKSDYWNKDLEKGLDDPFLIDKVFSGKNAVGIVTGFRSGITVIDIDTDKATGKTLTNIELFPKTYTVKTRSGGYHLYYQYYSEIASTSNIGGEKYKGLDCRNDGGFVFAPPTEIDGKQVYEVINNMEPQPFPVDLFKGINNSKASTSKFKGIKALTHFKGMAEGERDTALFTYANDMYKVFPMKEWPHVDVSIWFMNSVMKQPLSDPQVTKIADSARKYNQNQAKELDLVTDKKGEPKLELRNVTIILQEDEQFRERIRANTFAGTIEYLNKGVWELIKKSNESLLRIEMAEKYPFMGQMPRQHVEDAIAVVATENAISPLVEHFKTLKWDKTERLSVWLHKVYNIEDNIYYKEMGHHYLIGLVNRVMDPGCQMDNALVLDGIEGYGKSQSLRVLCEFDGLGTLFNETSESPDGKDFAISLLGNVITEFAEGAVFDYRDRKKVKSFISKVTDKYRPPYERASLDFPRQGVFAMSTNDSQYLEDRGINRRWWPVVLDRTDINNRANIKWLKENREQLYAEAIERKDENYWDFSKEAQLILNDLREDKKTEDETHAPIMEWYLGLPEDLREKGITKLEGWKKLDFKKDPTDFDLKKIGEFYTEILHLKPTRALIDGMHKRVFKPSVNTPTPIEELVIKNEAVNKF